MPPTITNDFSGYGLKTGTYLQERAGFAEARKSFERALTIFRKFPGDEHPSTKTAQGNLDLLK